MSCVTYRANIEMLALIEAILDILLRRRGPEALPDSAFLTQLLLVAYVACQVPTAVVVYGWSAMAAQFVALDAVMYTGFFCLLLRFTGNGDRLRQTLAALYGTGAVLGLAQLPLLLASRSAASPAERPVLLSFALLAFLVWMVTVWAHIGARALSRSLVTGMVVALAYSVISFQVSTQLSPQVPG
ncbi:MAG: hypothetical protein FJ197_02830 [Gammaproteobacteria bacterium]|nr:hypothetical protein [Gammaproteobacteria bacterium]